MRFKYLCILFQSAVRGFYLFMQIFFSYFSCVIMSGCKLTWRDRANTQIVPCSGLSSKNKRWQWGPLISLRLMQSGRPACLPLCLKFSSAAECDPSGLWAMSPALVTERETDKDPGSSSLMPWVRVTLWWVSTGSRIFFSCSLLGGWWWWWWRVCVCVLDKKHAEGLESPGVWSPSPVSCPNNVF